MQGSTKSAFRRLSDQPTTREIEDIFTPTESEIDFSRTCAKKQLPRIGCLLHLKSFQHLGYFIKLENIPSEAIQHIINTCNFKASAVTKASLINYDQSGSKKRHINAIRSYLGVSAYAKKWDEWLKNTALQAAETKHVVEDIINVLLEELVRNKLEIPGYDKLKRIAAKARKELNDQHFQQITSQLNRQQKASIDDLFVVQEGATKINQ